MKKAYQSYQKHIIHIIGISWAYHGKKKEFLNSFVSLTVKHIIHIIFTCVHLFNYLALFKDKKIIVPASQRVRWEGDKLVKKVNTSPPVDIQRVEALNKCLVSQVEGLEVKKGCREWKQCQ